jgi:ankyrin repeat protein
MTTAYCYNEYNDYAASVPAGRMTETSGNAASVRAQAQLMVCIYAKDAVGIKAMFAEPGAISLIDGLRTPRYFPVHAAVASAHPGVLRALVEALPAEILDLKDETTRTPLMCAAEQGMSAAVHTLLAGHASVDVTDRGGYSALMWASVAGHADTVKVLLGYEVCERHPGDDQPVGIDRRDQNGNTALMLAVRAGHYEVVEALIARRADVNAANLRGERALSIAIALGRHRMVRLLCEQNELDLDATDPKGVTALMQAADYASTTYDSSILNLLLKRNIRTELRDHDGYTAVLRMAGYGSDIALECLFAGGASADALDPAGCCAVAVGAKTNNVLALRYLLQLNKQWVEAQDHGGRTPLFHAVVNANREAAKLLIKHGADVNFWHDASNADLLMIARRRGDPAIITLLLEHGASDGVRAPSRSRAAACVA